MLLDALAVIYEHELNVIQIEKIRQLQSGLICNNLVPIRPFYGQILSIKMAMNSDQQSFQNEWSLNVLARKEVDFWC